MTHDELRETWQFLRVAKGTSYGLGSDEAESLLNEYDRLRAENEKLRAELEQLNEARQHWRSRMGLKVESDIVQENEKLRELVRQAMDSQGPLSIAKWYANAVKLLGRE